LKKDKDSDDLYIPYLVLFGVLYCATNTELKVQKFYELCQIDLDASIAKNDPELVELIPKLLTIPFDLMIQVYQNKKESDEPDLNENIILNED